ncbi:heme biosynthesis HemY N-terminal domain-containing protein [Thiogranum longum]
MKWLILAVLVLLISVSVALVALPDPGYILIGYGKYSIETSLLVFLVVLALAYLGVRMLAGVWHVPARVQRWGARRRSHRFRRLFDDATMELTDGRLERAERRLGRLLKVKSAPLQAYLSAARAANELAADDRRDAYLKLAVSRNPHSETAVALVSAELQLARSQLEQAQTTLTRLQALAPHNPKVLRLLMQLYVQQRNWSRLRELMPELRRGKVLDDDQWQQLAVQVYRKQVQELAAAKVVDALTAGWKQLPAPVKQDDAVLPFYIEQLLHLGADQQAGQLIRDRVKRSWSQRLVYLFGDLTEDDPSAQLEIAESWLEQHPEDPVLLMTLGKISLRNQLWGKARSYLEASIDVQATAESYHLLGSLLEQLDEPEKATECYRKGIALPETGMADKALGARGAATTASGKIVPISRSA